VEKALEQRIVGATVAGKYRIRRVVGAGSMGVVCEAEHLEIGKRLAIKIIDASLAGMSDIAMRFRQEARAASRVESQHIVQVFDVGADDKLGLYLVMEYLTGEDLAAMLVREERLSPDTAVRIAVQVARGLSKAHEAGVVHRDLKPANIFLAQREDDDPLVKILDFGISKVIDASRAESKLKLTRAGTVVGTPQYMSPEQAQGFSVDERTDVWALGLVLYEMLAGRPAYLELPTYEAFIIRLVSHPPDALATVAPWVPEKLADVVHEAIEHDLGARIPTCLELGRRLLEAHPVMGFRATSMSMAETADTWADASQRSPYAGADDGEEGAPLEGPAANEVDPPSRTVVMNEVPPEDSLTIDVDVAMEPTLPPPASAARPAPPLARSGIRSPSEQLSDDFADDAPQFFDRKRLETLGSPSSGPTPGSRPMPSPGVRGAPAVVGSRGAVAAHAEKGAVLTEKSAVLAGVPASAAARRIPLAWMALAFIALGLVVVAALALR
jgi:serine/threonine protein kinase